MDVLVTGAGGTIGGAIEEYLVDDAAHRFTYLDHEPPADDPTENGWADAIVADVGKYEAIQAAIEGHDAVVHLAVHQLEGETWDGVLETNVVGTYDVVEACRQADVGRLVFASSNHVVGMVEYDHAPAIYRGETDVLCTADTPHRPDSLYGTSKAWGEDLCRYYTEYYGTPRRCQALRIGSVHPPDFDHPYGPAERGVENGEWERDSDEYERRVTRQKALWQSRRDVAHQIACCLRDDATGFGVYYGVSDNENRWLEIESAKRDLGYEPADSGGEWDGPPA